MNNLTVALVGRFDARMFETVARELGGPELGKDYAAWGVAYCYGNRLEVVRSVRTPAGRLDFGALGEVRTDMGFICLCPELSREAALPLLRKERAARWAFLAHGAVGGTGRLELGERIPDGSSSGERLMIHLLNELDEQEPTASVERALGRLEGEPELGFHLLGADTLVVANWHEAGDSNGEELWFGSGELLRVVAPRRLVSVPEVAWEPIPNRAVVAVSRYRRPVA